MLNAASLQFLYDLSQNNNREWFEKNKPRYERELKKPFEQTVLALQQAFSKLEPEWKLDPKDAVFRIYRDTRFSADKTPYKTNVAAVFNPGGRKSLEFPGYYLHLEYGVLNLGGGAYFLEKDALHRLRTAITQQPSEFRALVENPEFVKHYGDLRGDKNKVMPPEFKEVAKTEPLLYHKQFYYMADLDPETAIRPDFVDFTIEYYRAAKPVNDFLVAALKRPDGG